MKKYSEVSLIYTSPAHCPEGVQMDKAYRLVKKNGKLYFTDGITEFEGEKDYIKMLFTPNCEWKDVDFTEDIEFGKNRFTK